MEQLPEPILTMDGYQSFSLNELLIYHILTMDGNRNIDLQWTATITSTYNGWKP